jgi:hypothetical protein
LSNRNYASGGKIYSMHIKPVLLDCNFVVDSTNGNGLGIRQLKGPMIQAVYMHTTATPAPGNPNPGPGIIVLQLADAFNRSFSGFNAVVSPVSGTPLQMDAGTLTIGQAYVITTIGNATAAQWLALGVPAGVTPAVGVSFVAETTGAGAGTDTDRVMTTAPAGSAIANIETVGDPNQSINPNPSANQGFGGQIILQCRNYAGTASAPADGSVISLASYLSDSSILVQGE